MRLSRSLPIIDGESAVSWLSRLASLNGHTLAEFCSDMGVSHRDFTAGKPDAIEKMAYLASADAATVTARSLVRQDRSYTVGPERIQRGAMPWNMLTVCPACLAEDEAKAGPAHRHGRLAWLLRSMRTCPEHGLSLVAVDDHAVWTETTDFALRVDRWPGGVDDLLERATRRAASGLEIYLRDRLRGRSASWLDGLELHAAALFCEMLGITEMLGRNPRLSSVTEEQWYKGGGLGFEIANGGEAGIRAFLETLRRTFPYDRTGQVKPNAVYGTLYKWAAFFARDTAFDPVRKVLADIIIQTFPVGPGDRICGRIVEERRVHSIRTASVETGLHRKRLRKLLALEGIISLDDAGRADGYVLFDA